MVHVVELDQAVQHATAVTVAAEVHPLARAAGVVDVIAADDQSLVGVVGHIGGYADVTSLEDLAILNGDVVGADQPDAVRAATEPQIAQHQVFPVLHLEDVLAAGGHFDQHVRPALGANDDRLVRPAGNLVLNRELSA